MNTVNLLGRLCKDVELKEFNDTKVASFTLAINRRKKDEADFIRCKAFNKTAEIIQQYCSKGHQLAVTGRIQTGSYEKDGITIYTFDIIVDSFTFVGSKNNDSQHDNQSDDLKELESLNDELSSDELPF